MHTDDSPAASADSAARRSFLVRLAAVVTGAIATLFPFAVGWGVLTTPLRRARNATSSDPPDSANFVPICPLDALPADGIPRPFAVVSDVTDAWTHAPARKIGSIFLTRASNDPNSVVAFSTTCPHLGCAVEFDQDDNQFKCPCHASGFAKDGQKLFGPSRRGLDSLPVKFEDKSGTKEVCVHFVRFEAGTADMEPIA
jgi:menaquinol-cytochrome c reductase iron-sulfur subunit